MSHVFAVALVRPCKDVFRRLEAAYPEGTHEVSDRLILVCPQQRFALANEVRAAAGIGGNEGDNDVRALVIDMTRSPYSGWLPTWTWEWLNKALGE